MTWRPVIELTPAQLQHLEDAAEAYWGLCEQLGETIAQHKGETALFGDSWPGAMRDIADLNEVIRKIEALLDAWPEYGPPIPAPYLLNPTTNNNEEPF
jgi:hypothetical protein